ncbi:hypothetical protein LCGC14_2936440, partial [marine sediment metagenome]
MFKGSKEVRVPLLCSDQATKIDILRRFNRP